MASRSLLLGSGAILFLAITATLAQQPAAPSPSPPGAPEKHIVCEHAAPPPGSHWVCDHPERPCDCHLESNVPGRPIFGEGAGQPWPPIPPDDKAAGAAACRRVSVKRFVAPFYPETARLGQVQGSVTVYAKLDRDGRVSTAIPEGPAALYPSALGALRQWTFHNPGKVAAVTVVFHYVLQSNSLTLDTPPPSLTADLPCAVEISTTPQPPSSYQRY
jgi:hypothetical protein